MASSSTSKDKADFDQRLKEIERKLQLASTPHERLAIIKKEMSWDSLSDNRPKLSPVYHDKPWDNAEFEASAAERLRDQFFEHQVMRLAHKYEVDMEDDAPKCELKFGSGPQGISLAKYLCCYFDPDSLSTCQLPGSLICSNCYLVGYCSKKCQKEHWKQHRKDCKQNRLSSPDWVPRWIAENRSPLWLEPEQDLRSMGFSGGMALFGNTPAFDVMNWKKNELSSNHSYELSTANSINIAFCASGDVRFVIETLASVPTDVSVPITFLINDYSPYVTARNFVILLLFICVGEEAIDAIIQLWYSSCLTFEQELLLKKTLSENLNMDRLNDICQFSHEKATLNVFDMEKWRDVLVETLIFPWDVQTAISARNKVMLHPDRKDLLDRYLDQLKPYHRVSWEFYRDHGLMLPFGAPNSNHNTPNNFLLIPGEGWAMPDSSDPLHCWPLPEVLRFGKESGLPSNDLYGMMFFYVRDRLCKALETMKRIPVEFQLYCQDAIRLADKLAEGKKLKFDRIDVSNIADENYVGLRKVLSKWGGLLNESNPNSALVTLFINWRELSRRGDGSLTKQEVNRSMKKAKDVFPTMEKATEVIFTVAQKGNDSPLKALLDVSSDFENYLAKHLGISTYGLSRRKRHRLVPPRFYVKINSRPTDVLDELSDDDFYLATHVGSHLLTERYAEWELERNSTSSTAGDK